jgi:hypothetical protein
MPYALGCPYSHESWVINVVAYTVTNLHVWLMQTFVRTRLPLQRKPPNSLFVNVPTMFVALVKLVISSVGAFEQGP